MKQNSNWLTCVSLLAFACHSFAASPDIDPASDPKVQPYAGTPVSGY